LVTLAKLDEIKGQITFFCWISKFRMDW